MRLLNGTVENVTLFTLEALIYIGGSDRAGVQTQQRVLLYIQHHFSLVG